MMRSSRDGEPARGRTSRMKNGRGKSSPGLEMKGAAERKPRSSSSTQPLHKGVSLGRKRVGFRPRTGDDSYMGHRIYLLFYLRISGTYPLPRSIGYGWMSGIHRRRVFGYIGYMVSETLHRKRRWPEKSFRNFSPFSCNFVTDGYNLSFI